MSDSTPPLTPGGREIQPHDSQIHCVQPGGGVCMRIELFWGHIRRFYLKTFRRGYIRRMAATRKGDANQCPCDVLDPRDLKFYANQPGYYWDPQDDPFTGRESYGFARAGLAEMVIFSSILIPLLVLLVYLALHGSRWWWIVALVPFLLETEVIWFFRNPKRVIPEGPGTVVSPADGKIDLIEEIEHDDVIDGPAIKIAIFLSVFNVHINRVPVACTVFASRYRQGKFLSALKPESAWENERLELWLESTETPHRVMRVRQITGQLARRIVCWAKTGETFSRGAQFGMIKLGSRTELIIPREKGLEVLVKLGDKVQAGSTVFARYK
ncbi:MAG: phosphatidylserine decarboxylase family protein [Planctomycetaceae bacterium]|jgi:phosphatidylserine decarboxylase|nr:phosphatidylserine decarboxylase family protein [Planctomycetaceae bacterium]